MEDSQAGLAPSLLDYLETSELDADSSHVRNFKVAVANIRKLMRERWDQWDEWIPTRDGGVARTDDREVFRNCIQRLENPLHIGQTLRNEPFLNEG